MSGQRRREILDAAAALFYRRGYHQVGMGDIGARVGMSGPAIYKHFRSKDEILVTLFAEALEGLTIGVEWMDDPDAELEELVRLYADFALTERELVAVYTHEVRSLGQDQRRRFRSQAREHAAYWYAVLGRVHPDADPATIKAAVQAAIGTILSVAYWPREAFKAPDLHETLSQVVLDGLRGLGQRNGSR